MWGEMMKNHQVDGGGSTVVWSKTGSVKRDVHSSQHVSVGNVTLDVNVCISLVQNLLIPYECCVAVDVR